LTYSYKLYVALEDYVSATKIAVTLAKLEQENGKYRIAHGILFETYKELESRRIKIPTELKRNLMLLHSYVLAVVNNSHVSITE
jgi:hypothetical protein